VGERVGDAGGRGGGRWHGHLLRHLMAGELHSSNEGNKEAPLAGQWGTRQNDLMAPYVTPWGIHIHARWMIRPIILVHLCSIIVKNVADTWIVTTSNKINFPWLIYSIPLLASLTSLSWTCSRGKMTREWVLIYFGRARIIAKQRRKQLASE
jgi:hypothetical protein